MTLFDQLDSHTQPQENKHDLFKGQYQLVQVAFNPDTAEYLNIGAIVTGNDGVSSKKTRFLDNFKRVFCLYSEIFYEAELISFMEEIESVFLYSDNIQSIRLPETIRLTPPLYISAQDSEHALDKVFRKYITLAKEDKKTNTNFRFVSTTKLKSSIEDKIKINLGLQADSIIHKDPFNIRVNNRTLSVNIPFADLDKGIYSDVVSCYYKKPELIERNLLMSFGEMMLTQASDNYHQAAISILRPNEDCQMSKSEYKKVVTITDKYLNRFNDIGVTIFSSDKIPEIAEDTTRFWQNMTH